MGSTTRLEGASGDTCLARVELFGGARLHGARTLPLRGARQVGLLALLTLVQGRTLSGARIADELWDGRRVSDAALRVNVKRLRQRFADAGACDPIRSDEGGYRLCLDAEQVDVWEWQHEVERARRAMADGDVVAVLSATGRAEELWVGAPFEGVTDVPSVAAEQDRLERLRIDAALWRSTALVHAGSYGDARRILDAASLGDPLREDVALARIVAAALEGRRDLALDAYRSLADALADEVGILPGSAVERAVAQIGNTEPDREALLAEVVPSGWRDAPQSGRGDEQVPVEAPMVDRCDELAQIERVVGTGVVVLHGPPGSGRSRIARELARRRRAAGLFTSITSCARSELGAGPVLRLLGPEVIDDEARPAGPGTPGGAEVARDHQRLRLHARAAAVLGSQPEPRAMIVDDLQWLDHSGAQLLFHLVMSDTRTGWLLVLRDGPRSEAAEWLLEALDRSVDRHARHVAVAPLGDEDAAELVRAVAAGFDRELTPSAVRGVVAAAGGWPALLVECTRQAVVGDDLRGAAAVDRVIDDLIDQLDADQQDLMQLMAIAGAPVGAAVLDAARIGSSMDATSASLRSLGALQLAEPHDGRWASRDYVRPHVLRRVEPSVQQQLHHRLATALVAVDGDPVLATHHLLLAGAEADLDLESVAGSALGELTDSGSFEEATHLACAFLDRLGPTAASVDGLRTRIQIVTVLISGGMVDQAVALHDLLAPTVRRTGDPVLRGASLAARAAIDIGGPERDGFVAEAMELIPQLPADEVHIRVTLASWAAHHLISAQQSRVAHELLEEAEILTAGNRGTHLRGIVLGVAYQAALNCDRTPDDADRAHRRLKDWVAIHSDPASEAMVRLLNISQAARNGSLADHQRAVDELEEMLDEVPRPDLRWSVAAARAAGLIAAGDRERAAAAVTAAGELGDRLHVGTAAGFVRVHQLQLLHLDGHLAVLSPFLGRVVQPGESAGHHALDALAADGAGDLGRRDAAVRLLRDRPGSLFGNGTQWVLTAFLIGEVARRGEDPVLAARAIDELEPHRGTGLTLLGLALLGAVDRTIGLAYAAMGDRRAAESHLRAAIDRDDALGYAAFAELSRAALADLDRVDAAHV